jgi:hypothetical protein
LDFLFCQVSFLLDAVFNLVANGLLLAIIKAMLAITGWMIASDQVMLGGFGCTTKWQHH